MSEVKRYDFEQCMGYDPRCSGGMVHNNDDGDYVDYADYAILKAEVKHLRSENTQNLITISGLNNIINARRSQR